MPDRLVLVADITSLIPCLKLERLVVKAFNEIKLLKIAVGDWGKENCGIELQERDFILIHLQTCSNENTKFIELIHLLEEESGVLVVSNNPIFIADIKKMCLQRTVHVITKKQGNYLLNSPIISVDISTVPLDALAIINKEDLTRHIEQLIRSNPILGNDTNRFCQEWNMLHRTVFSDIMKTFGYRGKPSKLIASIIAAMKI